jgi:tetratricopeptide (TPR) repeat protein
VSNQSGWGGATGEIFRELAKTRCFLMRIFSLIAVVLFVFSFGPAVQAGMEEDCLQHRDYDLKIDGCTTMIRSGQYSDRSLAIAYKHRANAYAHLDQYRLAIQDYDQVLLIDPANDLVFNGRGDAYGSLGKYERAVKDWEQAIRIDGVLATRWWQTKLKMKGHYSGAIDGIFGPGTRRGLLACARDPNC